MSQQLRRRTGALKSGLPRLSLIALAVAGLSQAQAAQFELGDVSVRVDSQIAVGSSWRTQNANKDYISRGTISNSAAANPSYQGSQTNNTDDGNMNFDKGDAFSQTITGNHSLSFSHAQYRNAGANLSFRYWYDHALNELDGASGGGQMNNWKNASAFDDAKSGIELMDAYVWGDFDVAGRPAQLIFGRHVLNWGESTFIQGGQNVANPIDVQALRRPGAELRDALLPVTMLSGSITLDDAGAFTLQGYYQLEWQRTRADACGTFFSNSDFAAENCGPVYFQGGITEEAAHTAGPFPGTGAYATTIAERAKDGEPSDTGQFGIALKWYAEQLNGTEFGISFQNIHSRLPVVGGILPDIAGPGAAGAYYAGGGEPTLYKVEFPEDQKVFAASFATLLSSGTAWSGEFTYRPDAPIQVNANDVLARGLSANVGINDTGTATALAADAQLGAIARAFLALPSGIQDIGTGDQKGYREFDVFQFQTTFLHDFNRVLAADNLRLISEIGFTYVNDLPSTDEMRFGRSSIYGSFGKEGDAATLVATGENFADNGYVTDFSWGYRIAAQLEYSNAFVGGLTLKPTVTWSHDVSGYGPEPGSQFYEGRKILGTALSAEYMNTYFGSLSYTHYFDTDYWDLDDRNFISLSVGMNY